MTQNKKAQEVLINSRNEFELELVNEDYQWRSNEEAVKGIFTEIVRRNLNIAFPNAQVRVRENVPCAFKGNIITTLSSITGKEFKNEVSKGNIIELNGTLINKKPNKNSSSEHFDLGIHITFEDGEKYFVILEFKYRDKTNFFKKPSGQQQQQSLGIIKDLERLSASLDENNFDIPFPSKVDDFMFIFVTPQVCKKDFVDYRIRTAYKGQFQFEFGEGVVKNFNGHKFEFKYKNVGNMYFLNFDSF